MIALLISDNAFHKMRLVRALEPGCDNMRVCQRSSKIHGKDQGDSSIFVLVVG